MSEFDAKKFAKNIKKKVKRSVKKSKNKINIEVGKSTSAFYFFGIVGSAIYFISTADGFWDGVLGVLKSLVWPAFLVFEALSALSA
jgi:hypothetical protein